MVSSLRALMVTCLLVMTSVDPQMVMYPQPVHVPMPVPVPMPVAIPVAVPVISEQTTKKPTTTTTTKPVVLGLPVPVPVPVPVHVPIQMPYSFPAFPAMACQSSRPPGCPPCPPCLCFPSCTPTFFSYCSPCHQQCRCKNQENVPLPMPLLPPPPPPLMGPPPPPLMGPPPHPLMGLPYGVAVGYPVARPMIAVVPFPPPVINKRPQSSCSSSKETSESESCKSDLDSSSSETDHSWSRKNKIWQPKWKKKRNKIRGKFPERRNMGSDNSHNEVKPVLLYVSKNGDVKYKRRLSKADALHLLSGNKTSNVQHRRGEIVLPLETMRRAKDSVVFKPPSGATISNLSVSFQVISD